MNPSYSQLPTTQKRHGPWQNTIPVHPAMRSIKALLYNDKTSKYLPFNEINSPMSLLERVITETLPPNISSIFNLKNSIRKKIKEKINSAIQETKKEDLEKEMNAIFESENITPERKLLLFFSRNFNTIEKFSPLAQKNIMAMFRNFKGEDIEFLFDIVTVHDLEIIKLIIDSLNDSTACNLWKRISKFNTTEDDTISEHKIKIIKFLLSLKLNQIYPDIKAMKLKELIKTIYESERKLSYTKHYNTEIGYSSAELNNLIIDLLVNSNEDLDDFIKEFMTYFQAKNNFEKNTISAIIDECIDKQEKVIDILTILARSKSLCCYLFYKSSAKNLYNIIDNEEKLIKIIEVINQLLNGETHYLQRDINIFLETIAKIFLIIDKGCKANGKQMILKSFNAINFPNFFNTKYFSPLLDGNIQKIQMIQGIMDSLHPKEVDFLFEAFSDPIAQFIFAILAKNKIREDLRENIITTSLKYISLKKRIPLDVRIRKETRSSVFQKNNANITNSNGL